MLGVFPDGLDAFDEQVAGRSFRHLRRSLQVLVHAPELIDGAEVGQRFDVFFVPTICVVLHVQRVRVVQGSVTR